MSREQIWSYLALNSVKLFAIQANIVTVVIVFFATTSCGAATPSAASATVHASTTSPVLAPALAPAPVPASSTDCAGILTKVKFKEFWNDFVMANGVAVTGDFLFPVEVVIKNLGLDPFTMRRFQSGRVLSIAEGVSGLLPYLLTQGMNVTGLDLWYGKTDYPNNFTGRLMREYVRDYGPHLMPGDAQKIPLENEVVDLVVSHMLVNNVSQTKQRKILKEALRVTAKGGQVRLFGFGSVDAAAHQTFLNRSWRKKISYCFVKKKYSINFRGGTQEKEMFLLNIYKLKDREALNSQTPFARCNNGFTEESDNQ